MLNTIAVLVPCYNEANRLDVELFQKFILTNQQFHFYFLNDGSTDSTLKVLSNLKESTSSSNVEVIDFKSNGGKAKCIQDGVHLLKAKNYTYIGFIDSDNAIPLAQLLLLLDVLKDDDKRVIATTSRYLNELNLKKDLRYFVSKFYRTFVSRFIFKTKIEISDIQCGCKMFKTNVIDTCFEQPFIGKWLFDTEIILRLRNDGYNLNQALIEVPIINLNNNDGSKISIMSKLKIFFELYLINKKYN